MKYETLFIDFYLYLKITEVALYINSTVYYCLYNDNNIFKVIQNETFVINFIICTVT